MQISAPTILLFYKFTPLVDPNAIRLWQRTLCEGLGLKGRIIISKDGINGTVGGELEAIKSYRRITREYPSFHDIDWKWSDGIGEDFPRLAVRVRDEIVTFGVPEEIVVDESGVVGGGIHLKPHEVHALVEQHGDDVAFFDARNAFEARIGKFRNAIVPDTRTTPDFIRELESGKYDHLKNKPVIAYCTGGVRCEVLTLLMKNRGFKEVYQTSGGIVRYGETFKDDGLWEGSLYVFDRRLMVDFSKDAKVLGICQTCDGPSNQFYNCDVSTCRVRIIICDECANATEGILCPDCRANT